MQHVEQHRIAALGLRVAQDLQRVALAQAAVCTTMATGKDAAAVTSNAAAGELLRQSNKHSQTLVSALAKLWGSLTPDTLASAGLVDADAAIASVAVAQPKIQAACKGRFAGSGKLISEASTTVQLELDKVYSPAILAAFEDVLAAGKNWAAIEKDVEARVAAFPAARKKLWTDTLKASKSGVAAAAGLVSCTEACTLPLAWRDGSLVGCVLTPDASCWRASCATSRCSRGESSSLQPASRSKAASRVSAARRRDPSPCALAAHG